MICWHLHRSRLRAIFDTLAEHTTPVFLELVASRLPRRLVRLTTKDYLGKLLAADHEKVAGANGRVGEVILGFEGFERDTKPL